MIKDEIHNFNSDNENTEIVKVSAYLGSGINSNGDCNQEIKKSLGLGREAMEELEKITKRKDVSLETKAKIIYTLLHPITMYRCESWTVKRAVQKIDSFGIYIHTGVRIPKKCTGRILSRKKEVKSTHRKGNVLLGKKC